MTPDFPDTKDLFEAPLTVRRPARQVTPLVFASPHSGRMYPAEFMDISRLDRHAIRRSEDAFVDDLFASTVDFGAPMLRAHFPRAYVDANREPFELDPTMFAERLPDWVNTSSTRVAAGLGTVAKIVAGGAEIYNQPLEFTEVETRIRACHEPYHRELRTLIDETVSAFGCCLLIDCHSMPSMMPAGRQRQPDVVLGDCHGSSCEREIVHIAEATLRDLGLTVQRNKPYAGGYTTRHYARPGQGVQTLQIEINRALYMDEGRIRPNPGYARLAERLRLLTARLCALRPGDLAPALAAE